MPRDLELYPLEDIVEELKNRNISFVFSWVDHQQFTKDSSMSQEIVWGIERGGNLVLQDVLVNFLNRWHEQVVKDRTAPGREA